MAAIRMMTAIRAVTVKNAKTAIHHHHGRSKNLITIKPNSPCLANTKKRPATSATGVNFIKKNCSSSASAAIKKMMFTKANRDVNATAVTMKMAGRVTCYSTMTWHHSHSSGCMQQCNVKNAIFRMHLQILSQTATSAMSMMMYTRRSWGPIAHHVTTQTRGTPGFSIMIKRPISRSMAPTRNWAVTTATGQNPKESQRPRKPASPATAAVTFTTGCLADNVATATAQKVSKTSISNV